MGSLNVPSEVSGREREQEATSHLDKLHFKTIIEILCIMHSRLQSPARFPMHPSIGTVVDQFVVPCPPVPSPGAMPE
jgi:hypothetical protein